MLHRLTKLAVTAAGGAAVLLAAGCGGGSNPIFGSGSSHHSSGALSPIQAINLAAYQAKQATSFSSTLDMQTSGQAAATVSGTMAISTKPSLLMNLDMSTVSVAGQSLAGGMQEIMTGQDLYLKMPELQAELHKPWIVMPLSSLSKGTGLDFSQLIQQAEDNDPLVQTQMFTTAKNAKAVGTQVIDGVETTHYTGSYAVSAGVAKLPSDMRATVTKQLQALGISQVNFNAWIDAQHQVRKISVTEPGGKEQVSITMQITSIGQPVNVTPPPASQVTTIPSSDLSGL